MTDAELRNLINDAFVDSGWIEKRDLSKHTTLCLLLETITMVAADGKLSQATERLRSIVEQMYADDPQSLVKILGMFALIVARMSDILAGYANCMSDDDESAMTVGAFVHEFIDEYLIAPMEIK